MTSGGHTCAICPTPNEIVKTIVLECQTPAFAFFVYKNSQKTWQAPNKIIWHQPQNNNSNYDNNKCWFFIFANNSKSQTLFQQGHQNRTIHLDWVHADPRPPVSVLLVFLDFSWQLPAFFPHSIWSYRFVSFPVSVSSFCFPALSFPFCSEGLSFSHAFLPQILQNTPSLLRCRSNWGLLTGPHLLHQQLLRDEASTPPLESPLGFFLQTLSVLISRAAFCLSSADVWGFHLVQRRTLCSDKSAEKWIKPVAGGKKTLKLF